MELIARIQAGNREAFSELYEQYKNLVFKTASLMLSDRQDAEDALQEVFISVYRSLGSYDPSKGAFTTWLHRITVNHCISRGRRRRIRDLPISLLRPSQVPGRRSNESRVDDRDEVSRAMAGLSEKLRAVIVLRYYWDLSYEETSQVLAIPVGTVKSRISAAMGALRKLLSTEPLVPFCSEEVRDELPGS